MGVAPELSVCTVFDPCCRPVRPALERQHCPECFTLSHHTLMVILAFAATVFRFCYNCQGAAVALRALLTCGCARLYVLAELARSAERSGNEKVQSREQALQPDSTSAVNQSQAVEASRSAELVQPLSERSGVRMPSQRSTARAGAEPEPGTHPAPSVSSFHITHPSICATLSVCAAGCPT